MFEDKFNFSIKWIVRSDELTSIKMGTSYRSEIFKAAFPNVGYRLVLYPNGQTADKNQVWLFLEIYHGMMESVFCQFRFSIRAASFTKHLNATFGTQSTWGCAIFDNNKKFLNSKFFFDNEMAIEVEGVMKGKGLKLYGPIRRPIIEAMLQRTDMNVVILVGGGKIKAHNSVLKNRSLVFANMLKDNSTDETMVIEITEFSFDIVKIVIDFCYDIDITSQITDFNFAELLKFSNRFQMITLKNTVESNLIPKITNDTVIHLSNISVKFNAKQLRECCVCFLLLKNYDKNVSKFAKFLANFSAKTKPKNFAEYLLKKKSEDPLGIKDISELDNEICDEIIARAFHDSSEKCL